MNPTPTALSPYNLPDALWLIREVSADIVPVDSLELTYAGGEVAVDLVGDVSWTKAGTTTVAMPSRPTLGGLTQLLAQTKNSPKAVVVLDFDPAAPLTGLLEVASTPADKPVLLQRQFYYADSQIEQEMLAFLQNKLGDTFGYNYSPSVEYYVTQSMSHAHVNQMALWVAYWLLDKRRQAISGAQFMRSKALGDADTAGSQRLVNRMTETTTKVGETFTLREREESDGKGAEDFTDLWGDKYGYLTKLQLYVRNRLEKLYGDFSLRDNVVISSSFTLEKAWRPNDYVDGSRLSGQTTDLLLGS